MARTKTTFTKERPGPGRPPMTPEQKDAKAALRLLGPRVVERLAQLIDSPDDKVAASVNLGVAKMIGLDEPQRVEMAAVVRAGPLDGVAAEKVAQVLEELRTREKPDE